MIENEPQGLSNMAEEPTLAPATPDLPFLFREVLKARGPDARERAGAQTQHQAQGHLLAFPGLLRSLVTWVSVLVVLSLPSIVGETRGMVRLEGMPGATGAGSATGLRRKVVGPRHPWPELLNPGRILLG